MLNYINISVFLPKMVPLKWGVGEFGGVQGILWPQKGEMEGTPRLEHTYQLKLHVTPFCCMITVGVGPCMVW